MSTGCCRRSGSPIFRDEDMRELFYQRVIESLDFGDDSYVILLATDSYDIPFKGNDDDELWEEGSNEVFDYIICCICPVKDARASLAVLCGRAEKFRGASSGHVLGNSGAGIHVSDRSTTGAPTSTMRCTTAAGWRTYIEEFIDGHLSYTEKVADVCGRAAACFQLMCCASPSENDCSLDVVKAVHGQIRQQAAGPQGKQGSGSAGAVCGGSG